MKLWKEESCYQHAELEEYVSIDFTAKVRVAIALALAEPGTTCTTKGCKHADGMAFFFRSRVCDANGDACPATP